MERTDLCGTDDLEHHQRVVVGVAPVQGIDNVVRRASCIAASAEGELYAVHVESTGRARSGLDGAHLEQVREVVSEVGATWREIGSADIAQALIDFACGQEVTQIVLGSSQRSRWEELTGRGSVVDRVTRLAARRGLDVHIIARHRERPVNVVAA